MVGGVAVSVICKILEEKMRWPPNRILPEDPLDILLFDPLPYLDAAQALMAIEDAFPSTKPISVDSIPLLRLIGLASQNGSADDKA
jgi:hypothetical protein